MGRTQFGCCISICSRNVYQDGAPPHLFSDKWDIVSTRHIQGGQSNDVPNYKQWPASTSDWDLSIFLVEVFEINYFLAHSPNLWINLETELYKTFCFCNNDGWIFGRWNGNWKTLRMRFHIISRSIEKYPVTVSMFKISN